MNVLERVLDFIWSIFLVLLIVFVVIGLVSIVEVTLGWDTEILDILFFSSLALVLFFGLGGCFIDGVFLEG